MTEQVEKQKKLFQITNFVFASLFIVLGIFIMVNVMYEGYDLYGEYAPESGFFPFVTAAVLVIAGIVLGIQTARGRYFQEGKSYLSLEKFIPMAAVIGIVFVSLLLVNVLGLVLSLFLIFLGIMQIVYRYKLWYSLVVSAIFIGIIYLVFHVAFSIRFVTGIFGF